MKEFILKLEDLFELSKNTIKPEDKFREYRVWDSLALLSLMAMLDDEYNITITRDDFQKIDTIQDLYNYLKKN